MVQILGLDDIETGGVEAFEQCDNLRLCNLFSLARIRYEAAAPVVDGEGVGEAAVGAFPPIQKYDSVAYQERLCSNYSKFSSITASITIFFS